MAGSIFEELKRRRVIRVAGFYIVAAWIIAQVADVMFPPLNLPPWTLTLVMALLVLGFPIAMVLAWAFDVGPGGVVRTEELPGRRGSAQTRAMVAFGVLLAAGTAGIFFLLYPGMLALNLVIAIGILLVATTALLFFLLYPRYAAGSAGTASEQDAAADAPADGSIAVLPFLNLSGDPENEYFSDGIAEELINVLSRIAGLKVAARTSSRHFKGRDEKVQTIAAELGVDTVLEGSVRRAGKRARVTATLINAADGYHLWSESYDRELDDIFVVQDDIARSIAHALRVQLTTDGGATAPPTENFDAYREYLRAGYLWKRRAPESIRQAIAGFEAAVRLDPRFARAHANLGAAYHKLPLYDLQADVADCQHHAEAAARRALEIDPQLGEANATLGSILADRHEYIEAERVFQQAVESDPNDPTSHHWYANFLLTAGRSASALAEADRAYKLDPLNAAIEGTLASAYFACGRTPEAIDHYRNAERLGWSETALALCGAAYLHAGDYVNAEACLRSGRLSGERIPATVIASLVGATDPAEQILTSLKTGEIGTVTAFRLCAMCGSKRIFTLDLDPKSLPAEAIVSLWWPTAAPVRRQQAFLALVDDLGLPPLWRANGWPDACQPEGESFVCS